MAQQNIGSFRTVAKSLAPRPIKYLPERKNGC